MTLRNKHTLQLASLEMTCSACPSQWEGKLDDGREVYIRYRCGRLRVYVAPIGTSIFDVLALENLIHEEHVGDDLDGVMGFYQVEALTNLRRPSDYLEQEIETWIE